MTDEEFWEQAIDYLFENTSLGKIVQTLKETDVSVEDELEQNLRQLEHNEVLEARKGTARKEDTFV